MSLEAVLPLFIFALVSSITPGGATTMSAASGANFGFRRSIPLMAGIAAGLASMAAAAALGLAGVLIAMPSLQIVLKAGGSAYLLWLAWKVGRAGPPSLDTALARPTGFANGVWLLWLNPKAWAMTLGAAASSPRWPAVQPGSASCWQSPLAWRPPSRCRSGVPSAR